MKRVLHFTSNFVKITKKKTKKPIAPGIRYKTFYYNKGLDIMDSSCHLLKFANLFTLDYKIFLTNIA